MAKRKVVLGLSGGVDSAVAAHLLMEENDVDVIGCYLSIGAEGEAGETDARAVAASLGIEFQVRDISDALDRHVKQPFLADYLSGRTPLPCARCNPLVKFPALLSVADALGAECVATGHYAQLRQDGARVLLCKGRETNDQSYLLAQLPQEILKRLRFPLGAYEKREVRALAEKFHLPVAEKPDSMEICFIPDNDYAGWLERHGATGKTGDFLDTDGHVLGHHAGIYRYTLGQGRGLGISGPHRYYVCKIDAATNTVTLSDGKNLGRTEIFCDRPNWIAFARLTGSREVEGRFRHSRGQTACTIVPEREGVRVIAHTPVRAPTPGQLAVFYEGDVVLGSAWIALTD